MTTRRSFSSTSSKSLGVKKNEQQRHRDTEKNTEKKLWDRERTNQRVDGSLRYRISLVSALSALCLCVSVVQVFFHRSRFRRRSCSSFVSPGAEAGPCE